MILSDGDPLKHSHHELREASMGGHRAGNCGEYMKAKTGRKEQEGQVKKDEVSINRKCMVSLPLKSYVKTRGEPHSQPGLNLLNTQLN